MASSSTGDLPLYCGPEDPSVLYLQPHHITESIISGNDTDTFQPRKLDNKIFQAPMHDRVLGHIERMGFGGVYRCGKPKMLDASLIGALIERWRPETHTFHLPVGEASVTLQDIEMLWGLRVDGEPVILPQVNYTREYWVDTCQSLLGIEPSPAELKLGGFNATTLKDAVRGGLDDDLPEHFYMQHARIFVLLLLGCLIIPDTSGRKIPFHHILLLVDEDQSAQLSWGAAALATLYHYLCEASCQKRKDIGGPLALLQMWAWERIPNIRPEIVDRVEYDGTTPCGIMWRGRLNVGRAPLHVQSYYREQLAHLHDDQFIWEPYLDRRPLPAECTRGMNVWACTNYLICYHIVEPHLGHRVARQFGNPQHIFPSETQFHIYERWESTRRGKASKNWVTHHDYYVQYWMNRGEIEQQVYPEATNDAYMDWFRKITVTYITRPGIHGQPGIHETASTHMMMMETLVNVYHCLSGSETAYHQDVQRAMNMVSSCMTLCGEAERLDFVPTQRSAIDTTRPTVQKARREGRPGVRIGGPGYRRDAGLAHMGGGCSDPPRASWHAGSSSQMVGDEGYSDINLDDYFGVRLQTQPEDEAEAEVEDDAEEDPAGVDEAEVEEDPAEDEAQETAWRESRTKARQDPEVASASSHSTRGLARNITKFFTRRTSSRTSKGVASNKFTPSSYK